MPEKQMQHSEKKNQDNIDNIDNLENSRHNRRDNQGNGNNLITTFVIIFGVAVAIGFLAYKILK